MGLLDMFFNKKPGNINKISELTSNAKLIIEQLECKYEYFPAADDDSELMAAYKAAVIKGRKEHFTPVIIVCSDTLADWLSGIGEDDKAGFRSKVLSDVIDGETYFDKLIEHKKAEYEVDDFSELFSYDEINGGQAITSFEGYRKYGGGIEETIIAYIPTDKPYEVFAWVPMGGWNECPCAEDMISASKLWYEKYNAVPAVISHDIVEFTARRLNIEEAKCVGIQQYAFCSDIVDQGFGDLGNLVDTLTKSEIWYFWWD